MNTYFVYYKKQRKTIFANSTLGAQKVAAQLWGAKKVSDVVVVLASVEDVSIIQLTSDI